MMNISMEDDEFVQFTNLRFCNVGAVCNLRKHGASSAATAALLVDARAAAGM